MDIANMQKIMATPYDDRDGCVFCFLVTSDFLYLLYLLFTRHC